MPPLVTRNRSQVFLKVHRLAALELPSLGLLSNVRLLATTEAYSVQGETERVSLYLKVLWDMK